MPQQFLRDGNDFRSISDPAVLGPDVGWRLAFLMGAVLGLVIFLMRLWLPESPRWLMTHGRLEDANKVLDQIEREFRARGHRFEAKPLPVIRLRTRRVTPVAEVARTHVGRLKRRSSTTPFSSPMRWC
jgi:MFS family permease